MTGDGIARDRRGWRRIGMRAGGFLSVALLLGTLGAAVPEALPAGALPTPGPSVSPSEVSFAATTVGQTATTTVTVSVPPAVLVDSLPKPSYTISGPSAAEFSVTQDSCAGDILVPVVNPSCTDTIAFSPTAAGPASATLSFSGSILAAGTGTTSVPLNGLGNGAVLDIQPRPSYDFGPTVQGTTQSEQFKVTNDGTASTVLGSAAVSGAGFTITGDTCSGSSLGIGASCTVTVQFAPTAVTAYSGSLTVPSTDSMVAAASVTLAGTGVAAPAQVTYSPSTLAFGTWNQGGTSTPMLVTLTNAGQPVTLSSISVGGPQQADFVVGNGGTCSTGTPLGAAPDNTCTVEVTFHPSTGGPEGAELDVSVNSGQEALTVPLEGVGVVPLTITPGPIGFGSLSVGSAGPLTQVAVYNAGPGPENLGSLSNSDPTDFVVQSDGCSNQTLAAMSSCLIDVSFAPHSTGGLSAGLSLPVGGGAAPLTVALDGTGLADTFSVTPPNHDFGTVADGTSAAPQVFDVTNTSGATVTPTVTSLAGPNAGDFHFVSDSCSGSPLTASSSCQVAVDFGPSGLGAESAVFMVSAPGSSSASILVKGTGGPAGTLGLSSSMLTFGPTQLGTSSPSQQITVTNNGGTAVTFPSNPAYHLSDPTDFSVIGDTCSLATLAPTATCALDVVFDPSLGSTVGALNSSLALADSAAGSPQMVSLTGTSTAVPVNGGLVTSAPFLAFGNQGVGTKSGDLPLTVTNDGSSSMTLGAPAVVGSQSTDFPIDNAGSDPCDGATLLTNQTCTVQVAFDPSQLGIESATLQIPFDGVTGTLSVPLSGVGTAPTTVTVAPNPVDLGTVTLGGASTVAQVTVTNDGPGALRFPAGSYDIGGPSAGEFHVVADGCSSTVVPDGSACADDVVFTPSATDPTGPTSASLSINDNAGGSPQSVVLNGTAAAAPTNGGLVAAPSTVAFGDEGLGVQSMDTTVTVTNNGASAVDIGAGTIVGLQEHDFGIDTDTCQAASPLPAGQQCTVGLYFLPGSLGDKSATFELQYGNGSQLTVPVGGTGVPQTSASLSPSPVDFGSVPLGTASAEQAVTVTNTGSGPLLFGPSPVRIAGSNAGDFTDLADTCAFNTVAPGDSCQVDVVFMPPGNASTVNAETATLLVVDNAGGSPQADQLTGTAVPDPVNLGLQANPTSVSFGDVGVHTRSADVQVIVSNTGGSPLQLGTAAPQGLGAGSFGVDPGTDNCSGTVLRSGQQCTLSVYFDPNTTGIVTSVLEIPYGSSGASLAIPLGGTGVPDTTVSVAPNPASFGNVAKGTKSQPLQITVTNTGASQLLFGFTPGHSFLPPIVGVNANDFSIVGDTCLPFLSGVDAGQSCTIDVVFSPSGTGPESAQLYLLDNAAGSPQTVNLSGYGTSVQATYTVAPSPLAFGSSPVGTAAAPQTLTVTNTSTNAELDMPAPTTDVSIVGPNAGDFSVVSGTDTCASRQIDPGLSCSLEVSFTPSATGPANATLMVSPTNGQPTPVGLTGQGLPSGSVSVSTTSVSFGNQQEFTTSSEMWVTVTNTSATSPLAIGSTALDGTDAAEFALANNYCANSTVAVGSSCKIGVTFTPTATGAASATLALNDNAGDTPQLVDLTGTGTAPVSLLANPLGGLSQGYWLVAADGGVFAFGAAHFYGSTGNLHLQAPVVAMASTADGGGYWLAAADGGVFSFGDAVFHGSMGGKPLNQPIVGMAATPDGGGYWMVASDGGVFSFGDANFYGSMGGKPLDKPIVGMAATPDGGGYWLVASDGGVFSFGDATFYGSMGGKPLNQPIVGMVPSPGASGYLLTASDGGVFAFGHTNFYGSAADLKLRAPVIGITPTPDGGGYWQDATDGGIFSYGDAVFLGSLGNLTLNAPIVGMAGYPG
ncbi:MAG: beta strand repeat-containing protein [Acidimicrobiales bacterium]